MSGRAERRLCSRVRVQGQARNIPDRGRGKLDFCYLFKCVFNASASSTKVHYWTRAYRNGSTSDWYVRVDVVGVFACV